MKLHSKIQLLKFCSTFLNFIFLVLGLSVAGCGLWILFDSSFISVLSSSSDALRVVATALLAVGALVLVACVLECVGAQRESRVLLLPVAVVLVLLILAQISISFLLLTSTAKMSNNTMMAVDKLIQQYPTGQPLLLDNLQHYVKCCGREDPSDWLENTFVQSLNQSDVLPCSCFTLSRLEPGAFCSANQSLISEVIQYGNSSHSQGCEAVLREWITENLFTIIGMNLGLILIQVAQLVVVVSLYRSFGAKSSVKSCEPDPDQDQVDSDQEQLHQDQDSDLYHGANDGPYGEPYEEDTHQDYS